MPHCGETNQHAPTQTSCNLAAIGVLTHVQPGRILKVELAEPVYSESCRSSLSDHICSGCATLMMSRSRFDEVVDTHIASLLPEGVVWHRLHR